MSSLTYSLRNSTAEICAFVDENGADASVIGSNLDALSGALEGRGAGMCIPASVGRAVGTAVLDWLETRDTVLSAREGRIPQATEATARGAERMRFILSNAHIRVGGSTGNFDFDGFTILVSSRTTSSWSKAFATSARRLWPTRWRSSLIGS